MHHFEKSKLATILAVILITGAAAAHIHGRLGPPAAEASLQGEDNPAISTLLGEMNMSVAQDNPTVPDFELLDLDGNVVRLSDFRGEAVLLGFFTTW